ncbi:ribosomal protection-like ABC-F family protein [Numidum massiliense]|uniref:ribosomal protection-like ABC-F family protein n=1 Tax=Numidum massiliense TaxID=1522315 RepID=UPI0006D56683|nr:ABC-F type ribosomal protection protein [Numidum massiliense]
MLYMQARHIAYTIGERVILNIPKLQLYAGDRIGLVGKNGQGKTLLLSYLLGKTEERPQVEWHGSVGLFEQLNTTENGHEPCPHEPCHSLSGGEKTALKLEQLFSEGHDVLLLDEPTNNLDWEGVEALEQKLKYFRGAFVLASHDRAMLDAVCTKIWELDDGKLTEFSGNYTHYQREKEVQRRQREAAYAAYTQEKKRLVERYRQLQQRSQQMKKAPKRMGNSEARLHKGKASSQRGKVGHEAKMIRERFERLERVNKPFEWDTLKMDLTLHTPLHRRTLLTADNLEKHVGRRHLYTIPRLTLRTGSKTALIGANGSGKTTLMKQLLAGDEAVDRAANVKIGLFEQQLEKLPAAKTVLAYVQEDSVFPQHIVRTTLARLRFYREDVHKKIGVLSGGERVKVAIAKLLTGDYNFLMLDEPTNHLDVEALEALEELIKDYPGTVLFVTHDRRLIENTADSLWMLENGTVHHFSGTYQEWKKQRRGEANAAQRGNVPGDESATRVRASNDPATGGRAAEARDGHVTDDRASNTPITNKRAPVASATKRDDNERLALETKLTELISRLSVPSSKDDLAELEREYARVLAQLKRVKKA